MIPTVLVLGVFAGLLRPKFALIGILVISVLWAGILVVSGVTSSSQEILASAFLALINAAIAASMSHLGVTAIRQRAIGPKT